jgi:hypothetical protein
MKKAIKKKAPKIKWWASSDLIRYMGPFDTQLEAWEAMMSSEGDNLPVKGTRVWCSTKDPK